MNSKTSSSIATPSRAASAESSAEVGAEIGAEVARLADLAWNHKRAWWVAWLFPFPLYYLSSRDRSDPLDDLVEVWPILTPLEWPNIDGLLGMALVLGASLLLRSRFGTALAAFAQAVRAGVAMRPVLSFAKDRWRASIPLLATRFILGSLTLSLLLLPAAWASELFAFTTADGFQLFATLLLLSPVYLLALVYGMTLDACTQLAIQSLAANNRGAASAFQHGWRLLCASPSRSAKVVAGWTGFLFGFGFLAFGVLYDLFDDGGLFAWLCLIPFAGTFSAFYWAEAYHRMGGLRTVPVDRL